MPLRPFQKTALAFALAQAFIPYASSHAQSVARLPEVVVTSARQPASGASTASIGGFGETPLMQTPASVSVIGSEQLQALQLRTVSEAVRLDASVSDAYNAVGYAEQFSIRGFALDNARSYRKDGLVISGDASIPLENKERLEILKGLAGLQLGVAVPGGVLNYVTKRPTSAPLRSLSLGLSERGTAYGALDIGGSDRASGFGYRINLAAESLRSYVRGADGERQFASAAFDWQLSPRALLQLDFDFQHKSQISQPGWQLTNGTDLPRNVDPSLNLNNQPWSKPVVSDTGNLGLRFEYQVDPAWRASIAANKHYFKRDDFAAFPWGCAAGNLFPGYCANGDYDVYDYQSAGEKKPRIATQALLQGKLGSGGITHELSFGASTLSVRDYAGDCVYGAVDCDGSVANGSSNVYHPLAVPASTIRTGPVTLRNRERERALFVQDIVGFGNAFTLHAGARHTSIEREDFKQSSWLPNLALVYSPQPALAFYGAYSQGLEPGGIAPLGTVNFRQQLAPNKSRQLEAGVKATVAPDLNFTAAVFDISKPLEQTNAANVFARAGDARHRGVELALQGRIAPRLQMIASVAALDAKQRGTGDATLDGHRVTDVPRYKAFVGLDYSVQQIAGLSFNGSVQAASDKAFDPANTVIVPSYHVFNLGMAYSTRLGSVPMVARLAVDNVTDKFYWRDVTPALGGYLYPGAPRLYRATVQFTF